MGNNHKPKAGRLIRQQQTVEIQKLNDKLLNEKLYRKSDREQMVENLSEIAMELFEKLKEPCRHEQKTNSKLVKSKMPNQMLSATTFWIVCSNLGFNSVWGLISDFAPESKIPLVKWMFEGTNINHECRV